jgi:hypothetical protein
MAPQLREQSLLIASERIEVESILDVTKPAGEVVVHGADTGIRLSAHLAERHRPTPAAAIAGCGGPDQACTTLATRSTTSAGHTHLLSLGVRVEC